MSGTDVMNHVLSCNCLGIRSKQWRFPQLIFCLQSSLYNSYLIYRKTPGTGTAYLDFLRPAVQNYIVSIGKSAKIPKGQMVYGNKAWKTEHPRQPEMVKFLTLQKMLKKEQNVLLVIN